MASAAAATATAASSSAGFDAIIRINERKHDGYDDHRYHEKHNKGRGQQRVRPALFKRKKMGYRKVLQQQQLNDNKKNKKKNKNKNCRGRHTYRQTPPTAVENDFLKLPGGVLLQVERYFRPLLCHFLLRSSLPFLPFLSFCFSGSRRWFNSHPLRLYFFLVGRRFDARCIVFFYFHLQQTGSLFCSFRNVYELV